MPAGESRKKLIDTTRIPGNARRTSEVDQNSEYSNCWEALPQKRTSTKAQMTPMTVLNIAWLLSWFRMSASGAAMSAMSQNGPPGKPTKMAVRAYAQNLAIPPFELMQDWERPISAAMET